MGNQKLTYAQLVELNQEQKNEIDFLKARLAQFDARSASPEIVSKSQTSNYDRLQLAAKAAGLGYFEWFPKTNLIEWDPVMHDIFGIEPDSKLDKNQYFYDIIHPDDKERVSNDTNNSLDANCKQWYFPTEYKIVLPGGLRKHIQAHSLHFRNEAGEVVRIIGACQDISERRESQQKVRESALRYSELVETINSGVASYKVINKGKSGKDYIILDFNKTALQIEGIKKEDVVGKSLKDLRPNIDDYGLIEIFRKVWETGEPAQFPTKVYTDKKFNNHYENRVYRLPNNEIVAIYDDVTERENALQKAIKAIDRFNIAMNATKDGLYDWDLKTNEVYYSPAWKKMLGYEDHELENHLSAWEKLMNPEDAKSSWQMLQKLLDKEIDRFELEFKMKHKKGHWVDILSRAEAVFDENAKAVKVVGTHINISERNETARTLLENKNLLEAIAENYPNSFVSIINKNFTVGFSSGQEFKNQNLDPESFVGLTIKDIFGDKAALIKKYYQKTFEGEKQNFELYLNEQYQIYKTVPLLDADGKIKRIMAVVENITSKRLTEIALEASEEKYRLLAENSVEVIWQMDLELNFTYVNPAIYKTLGYTPEEWIGTNLSKYAKRNEFFKMARQAIYSMKNYRAANYMSFETNMLRKDGTAIPVEINGRIVFNNAGLPIGVQGATRDISERKKAEETIRKSEEQFRLMFENHNAVMLLINPTNGRIIRANKSAEKFYGYNLKEITRMSIDDINALSSEEVSDYRRKASEGKINSFQFCHILKDGTIKNVEVHSTMNVFEGVEVLFSIIHDVTKKVLAEDALKQSEGKYRLLLNNQTDLIVKVDKENRFLFVSPNYCKAFGKTENELIGNTFMPLVHEDDREATQKQMETLFHPPHTCLLQQRALTVDGWLWFEWVDTAVLDKNGKVKEIVGVGRNITERKNAESKMLEINEELAAQNEEYLVLNEELTESMERIKTINKELALAKENAQESDRLKSAFLANMSHEIRTPMNGILGFAGLLKEPGLSGEEQNKYIGIIEKSGDRMLNIINDLIDISKIEAGQMEVVISTSNISDQMEYLYTFFKPEAELKNLHLSFTNPLEGKKAIILTDREKMYAVLTNLIKNAVKYTPSGSIDFGYELRQIEGKPFLRFYVKDTGIGIRADRQQAIFERFIQADIEDKQVYEGAGLGLAISKAYVEMMGGEIWVESQEILGSEFYFTIPYNRYGLIKNNIKKSGNEEGSSFLNQKLKVLIAEDDETSNYHLSIIIQDITKDVLFAKTGKEALELCKQNADVDLVLMDLKMPVMDGYEATREIRKLNKKVVIIAQTAYALTGDREKALEAGCNDYISKPINKGDLFKMIRKHV